VTRAGSRRKYFKSLERSIAGRGPKISPDNQSKNREGPYTENRRGILTRRGGGTEGEPNKASSRLVRKSRQESGKKVGSPHVAGSMQGPICPQGRNALGGGLIEVAYYQGEMGKSRGGEDFNTEQSVLERSHLSKEKTRVWVRGMKLLPAKEEGEGGVCL